MRSAHRTSLLRRLHHRHVLAERLAFLGVDQQQCVQWLTALARRGSVQLTDALTDLPLEMLQKNQLVRIRDDACEGAASDESVTIAMPFVSAVNFELTYACDLGCAHCLQQNLRYGPYAGWLPTEWARQAIEQAWFADLAELGVNFTGGGIFHPDSNMFDLIKHARSFNLQVRINTSGWWGQAHNINVGGRLFDNAASIVSYLREHGIAILALSCDTRFERKPWLWDGVVSIVRACERARWAEAAYRRLHTTNPPSTRIVSVAGSGTAT